MSILIIVDNGISESIECDNCDNLFEIPNNNFNENKRKLFISYHQAKKCFTYLKSKSFINIIYRLLLFSQTTRINTPSFKSINLIVNKDKIRY